MTLKAAAFLAAALCTYAGTASAFDTGIHFDITEDVLHSEGFETTSIQTAQAANFMVDFYEFIGNPAIAKILDADCRKKVETALKNGDAQHFDDLYSTKEIADKWDAMVDNTKSTAASKAASGDLLGLLALLGMSLHNVQDFYAHSNWVEGGTTGPPLGKGTLAKYGDHPTWLSMDRGDREALDVYTRLNKPSYVRVHGDWNSGPDALNKDWSGRPHHADAYICAYFASRQWVRLFQTWVGSSTVWFNMQHFGLASFDPRRDWDYARKISFYGGHWNGNGGPTGLASAFSSATAGTSPDLLINAVLGYMGGRCLTKNPSRLRTEAENLLLTWGAMAYHGPVAVTLPSAAPESLQFVQIQVHRIDKTDAGDGFLGGQMDWYSRASIEGQHYWSGLIDEHDNFDFDKAPYAPWTMTKAYPMSATTSHVLFELMELDYRNDDLIDINPKKGARTIILSYSPSSGTVSGDVSGSAAFTTEGHGDCDCARVKMSLNRLVGACLR